MIWENAEVQSVIHRLEAPRHLGEVRQPLGVPRKQANNFA